MCKDATLTTSIKLCKDPENLGQVIRTRLEEGPPLNCIHISAAVSRLAKLQHSGIRNTHRSGPLVNLHAEEQFTPHKGSAHAWLDSETMPHLYASPLNMPAAFIEQLVSLMSSHIDQFQPRQVATILRAISLLPDMSLLASSCGLDVQLMKASQQALSHSKPLELCCIISAITRLNWHPSRDWLLAFMAACSSQWSYFNLHELSMILWSMAKTRWHQALLTTNNNMPGSCCPSHNACPEERGSTICSADGHLGSSEEAVSSWIHDLLLHQVRMYQDCHAGACKL
jgi:hypothetical protein